MAGGLNPTTATACAELICTASGISDPASKVKVANVVKAIYASLLTDIVITILSGSIATAGTATAQSGPPTPIPLTPKP